MNKRATCHCGNITIEVNQAPDIVTDCHCSICRRYAALWAYYAPDEVVRPLSLLSVPPRARRGLRDLVWGGVISVRDREWG